MRSHSCRIRRTIPAWAMTSASRGRSRSTKLGPGVYMFKSRTAMPFMELRWHSTIVSYQSTLHPRSESRFEGESPELDYTAKPWSIQASTVSSCCRPVGCRWTIDRPSTIGRSNWLTVANRRPDLLRHSRNHRLSRSLALWSASWAAEAILGRRVDRTTSASPSTTGARLLSSPRRPAAAGSASRCGAGLRPPSPGGPCAAGR